MRCEADRPLRRLHHLCHLLLSRARLLLEFLHRVPNWHEYLINRLLVESVAHRFVIARWPLRRFTLLALFSSRHHSCGCLKLVQALLDQPVLLGLLPYTLLQLGLNFIHLGFKFPVQYFLHLVLALYYLLMLVLKRLKFLKYTLYFRLLIVV